MPGAFWVGWSRTGPGGRMSSSYGPVTRHPVLTAELRQCAGAPTGEILPVWLSA